MKKFWKFQNVTKDRAELLLYGDISDQTWFGDEVTPRRFTDELNALGNVGEITVRINSGGGDVFAAQAIGNLLESHPAKVTAAIDGLCASAATVVACHCDRVVAAVDATYMVHPVKMGLCGYMTEEELRGYMDAITSVRESILALYVRKTGREAEELAGWMDATSWWTAQEAKEKGFVDALTGDAGQTTVENRGGVLFVNHVSMGLDFDRAPEFVKDGAGRFENINVKGDSEMQEQEIRTVDQLRAAYPDLVEQIEDAAADGAVDRERQRIRDIEEMTLPGGEALAREAKYEKPVDAAVFAQAVVRQAREKGAAWLNAAAGDANASGAGDVPGQAPEGAGEDKPDAMVDAIRALGEARA